MDDTDPKGRRVSEEEFYASVGQLNVHPSITGAYHPERGYLCRWMLQDASGKNVGFSDGGTHLMAHRYWLLD